MKYLVSIGMFVCLSAGLTADDLVKFETFFQGKSASVSSAHFRVTWADPRDALLSKVLLDHLERARAELASEFLIPKMSKIVPVEIFPDLKSFSAVSELPIARFKATGTIALTLDQRLMLLSPRTLPSGYHWTSTAVHEFIHYLIREISMEYIPIWLHEGTAQLFQGYPEKKDAVLEPAQWGLFQKYRKKAELLNLKTLREPFPYRKNPEEAELAYVQALLFTKWLNQKCGILKLIRWAEEKRSVEAGLELCTGMKFSQLENIFLTRILAEIKVPDTREVQFYARDFGSGDAFDREGQVADRKSRNFAQLSQELFKQGRFRPAAFEMEKAFSLTPSRPPSWSRHLAISYEKSGQATKAKTILEQNASDYPNDAGTWFLLGRQRFESRDWSAAFSFYFKAFAINPFMDGLIEDITQIKDKNPEIVGSLFDLDPKK